LSQNIINLSGEDPEWKEGKPDLFLYSSCKDPLKGVK